MIRIGRRGAPPPRLHSWRSLVRTARAPIGILVLASIGLVLPKQTADELNALSDMQAQPMLLPGVVLLQVSLGLLALSAWYWAKAAFSARFGADDSLETRPGMETADRAAFEAVPRIVFLGGVLLAAFLLWRGFSWVQALSVAVWGVPAYILIRWHAPVCTRALERRARLHRLRSTSNLRVWPLVAAGRVRALLILAPFGSRVSVPLLIAGILPFVWGAIEGYVRLWPSYPGLPAYAAQVFPGPSVALIGLALLIAPFSALIIAADGFRMETVILSRLTGFARPPVMTCLVVWTAAAPLLFSLHTVRTVEPSRQVVAAAARAPLDAFLADWIKACGQNQDAVLHPIVVAVSGGASRAGIWGAHVLAAVQAAAAGAPNAGVFAVSSVSGGSLGAAAYLAVMQAAPRRCGPGSDAVSTTLERLDTQRLGGDGLGPLLAGALLNDMPRALFAPAAAMVRAAFGQSPRGGDRAEALERAFEHLWRADLAADPNAAGVPGFSAPFLSLFYDDKRALRPGMPIWITNGTDVTSGGRVLTEPFGSLGDVAWPFRAATDAIGLLDADVPISTAINNSARFAYLEPAGELVSVVSAPRQMRGQTAQLIDGGYFDNEGLQTAYEMALWLQDQHPQGRSIEPIIVQATANADLALAAKDEVVRCPNAPVDIPTGITKGPKVLELLAPVLGLYNVRQAHTAVLLREVRDHYCDVRPRIRHFFHFYLFQGEAQDIPLNWLLSAASVGAIRAQLPLGEPGGVDDQGGNTIELAGLRAALYERPAKGETAEAR